MPEENFHCLYQGSVLRDCVDVAPSSYSQLPRALIHIRRPRQIVDLEEDTGG